MVTWLRAADAQGDGGVGGTGGGNQELGSASGPDEGATLCHPCREAHPTGLGKPVQQDGVFHPDDRRPDPDPLIVDKPHPGGHQPDGVDGETGLQEHRIDQAADFITGGVRRYSHPQGQSAQAGPQHTNTGLTGSMRTPTPPRGTHRSIRTWTMLPRR